MKVIIDGIDYVPEAKEEREIRHGDYGVGDGEGGRHPRLAIKESGHPIDIYNEMGAKNPGGRNPKHDIWLGNVFDDLTGEDLEEFEVECIDTENTLLFKGSRAKGQVYCVIESQGKDDSETVYFDTKGLKDLHRKLGRLIATAKKRKCKGKDC